MLTRRLIFADVAGHKVRTALGSGAVALAVSLIVAITSGYASLEGAVMQYFNQFMGSVDAEVRRSSDPHAGVSAVVETELGKDAAVQSAVGRIEWSTFLIGNDGKLIGTMPASIVGVDGGRDPRLGSMQLLEGNWFGGRDGNDAVIDQVAEQLLHVKIGDTFEIPSVDRKLMVRVCGVVHKPTLLAQQVQTVYVPVGTLGRFIVGPTTQPSAIQYSRINVVLREGVDSAAFAKRWRARLAEIDPTLKLNLAAENRQQLDRLMLGLRVGSALASSVGIAVAGFIIFTALTMGVSERQRTLAMLRAIGADRFLLGKLVVGQGLALAGLGAMAGVPLGLLWIYLLRREYAELFSAGVVVSWGGIGFAAGAAAGAAVLASLIPAVSAMRLSPMEAMSPLAKSSSGRVPWWSVAVGLVLISLDPLFVFVLPAIERRTTTPGGAAARELGDVILFGHLVLGVPGLMLGFFFLAPLVVAVVDRAASGAVARVMGVRAQLLGQQMSSGLWRCAGTAAALMVGLGMLVVLHTQASSVMGGWKLPTKFPDMFIVTYKPGGLNSAEQEKLKRLPGIREIMGVAVASPQLGSGPLALAGAAVLPDATMFFGADPEIAFDMNEMNFREGNAAAAREMMKQNRRILVTQEFQELRGLHVGDRLQLRTPRHGMVDYTIAGVISSPGIDVIVSQYDMARQFDQRTVASVFGTLHDAAEDFGVTGCYLFMADLQPGVSRSQLMHEIEHTVGTWGLSAGDVRDVKERVIQGFQRVLLLATTIALAALAISSLGVANAVMAAVRSRRWQFGVLRSVGLSGAGLLRLVMAESVLLALVGVVLGLGVGFVLVLDAHEVTAITVGYRPVVVVPWGVIGLGAAAVMVVALAASAWPAISTARQSPLALLSAGRASA